MQAQKEHTLNSLINEYARLAFWKKKTTILSIFHATTEKNFHHSFIFHVINEKLFPPYPYILVCLFIREFRVKKATKKQKMAKVLTSFPEKTLQT